jgi:hypothetical protein
MNPKEELEIGYLEGFLENCPMPPTGVPRKSENPDFLVETPEGTLGIELTRIFMPGLLGWSTFREQEALRRRVADEAKRLYDATSLPAVHVSLFFNEQFPIAKRDVGPLSRMLADLAVRNLPEPESRREEEYNWLNRSYFSEQLIAVSCYRYSSMETSTWSTPAAAFLPKLSPAELQAELDRKADKLNLYRKKCLRVWLAVCTYGEGLSSIVELSEDAIPHRYQCEFDRAFFFRWPRQVYELALSSSQDAQPGAAGDAPQAARP